MMGVLYLLLSRDGTQVKIGITKSLATLKARLASLGGAALFNLESSRFFHCERARAVEQFLHFHFRHSSIVPSDAFVKDGTTECFSADVMVSACEFIEANSAGRLIVVSETALVGVERACVPVGVESNAHVDQWRLAKNRAADAERRATVEQFNEQCYLLLAHTIKTWNDRRVLVGRYRADGELRIALRAVDVCGAEYDLHKEVDFTQLQWFLYPQRGSCAVFPRAFSNGTGTFLTVCDWFASADDMEDVAAAPEELVCNSASAGIGRLLSSIPFVDDGFDSSPIHDGSGSFLSDWSGEFFRFGEVRA